MRKGKHGRVTSSKGDPRESLSGGRDDGRTRPELARRRANRKSAIMSGRTIGEKRERLETKNERAAARKKDKKKAARRIIFTIIGFLILIGILVYLAIYFLKGNDSAPTVTTTEPSPEYHPTIEIVDEDASAANGKITSRMETFIGQAERDFKDLNYTLTKAVIPTGSIREVDFYLQDHPGFIKTTIDRGSAVSVEDADRMIRYLAGQGTTEYQYIDVRLPGRAYWK